MENYQVQIGSYLKSQREEKGKTLKEVAQQTRINFTILEQLENDDLDSLPSQTYVMGFVKSYLNFLKVDSSEALEILKRNYSDRGDNPHLTQIERSKKLTPKNDSLTFYTDKLLNKRNLIFFIGFFLLFSIYQLISYLSSSPPTEKVAEESEAPKVVESTEIVTEKQTTTTLPQEAPKVTEKKELPPKKEEVKEEKKESSRFPYIEFKEIEKALYTLAEAENPNEIPAKLRYHGGDENYLYIIARRDDCWIRYKTEKNEIKSFVLKQGRYMFARGQSFFINVGNITGLDIYFNNKKVQATSSSGFKQIILPPEEATEHQSPLFVQDKLNQVYFYTDYIDLMDDEEE